MSALDPGPAFGPAKLEGPKGTYVALMSLFLRNLAENGRTGKEAFPYLCPEANAGSRGRTNTRDL